MVRYSLGIAAIALTLDTTGCASEPPPSVEDYRQDCESDADCVPVTPSKVCRGECSGCGPVGAVNAADASRWAKDEAERRCSPGVFPVTATCNCAVLPSEPRCVNRECEMVLSE